ncbi:MAG: GreA/GreB family elongation factor [Bacteroidales bacterium]|nr:GreA/GreB family elongation factor [Bacteroidales bacterium]
MENNINITEQDYQKLCDLVRVEKSSYAAEKQNLTFLGAEIRRAKRVKPKNERPRFVQMNSHVEFVDLDTNLEMKIQLVYPHEANFRLGKVSVLSLLGSALLGYEAGSVISFNAPRGIKKIKIMKITYPKEDH